MLFAGNNYVIFMNEQDYKEYVQINYKGINDYIIAWNAYIRKWQRPEEYPCAYKFNPSTDRHSANTVDVAEVQKAKEEIQKDYNNRIYQAKMTEKRYSIKKILLDEFDCRFR